MQTVDLEVVIPAFNEQDRIGRTLERIKPIRGVASSLATVRQIAPTK